MVQKKGGKMEQNNPTSNQDSLRNPDGTLKQGAVLNPEGKGGLQERPEDINRTGRPKNEQRFGYWLQFFKNLTSKEFKEYALSRNEDDMYVAEIIAYERVKASRKDLGEYKDLADRTEGKALQTMKHEGDMITGLKVEIVNGTETTSD